MIAIISRVDVFMTSQWLLCILMNWLNRIKRLIFLNSWHLTRIIALRISYFFLNLIGFIVLILNCYFVSILNVIITVMGILNICFIIFNTELLTITIYIVVQSIIFHMNVLNYIYRIHAIIHLRSLRNLVDMILAEILF